MKIRMQSRSINDITYKKQTDSCPFKDKKRYSHLGTSFPDNVKSFS